MVKRVLTQESQLIVVWNSTETVLTNLRHHQEYSIEIIACHDHVPPYNDNKRCSQRAITSHRTLPIPELDVVDMRNVTIENGTFDNGTKFTFISWLEPPTPNGLILSYTLEVKKQDVADVSNCVMASSRSVM